MTSTDRVSEVVAAALARGCSVDVVTIRPPAAAVAAERPALVVIEDAPEEEAEQDAPEEEAEQDASPADAPPPAEEVLLTAADAARVLGVTVEEVTRRHAAGEFSGPAGSPVLITRESVTRAGGDFTRGYVSAATAAGALGVSVPALLTLARRGTLDVAQKHPTVLVTWASVDRARDARAARADVMSDKQAAEELAVSRAEVRRLAAAGRLTVASAHPWRVTTASVDGVLEEVTRPGSDSVVVERPGEDVDRLRTRDAAALLGKTPLDISHLVMRGRLTTAGHGYVTTESVDAYSRGDTNRTNRRHVTGPGVSVAEVSRRLSLASMTVLMHIDGGTLAITQTEPLKVSEESLREFMKRKELVNKPGTIGVKDAAALAGCSTPTLRAAIRRGELDVTFREPLRVTERSVLAWREERATRGRVVA